MSIEVDIWNGLKNALEAARNTGGSLSFVSTPTIEGVRQDVPQGAFPCIIMEPDNEEEDAKNPPMPLGVKTLFRVTVSCMVLHAQFDKAIVGDGQGNRGVLDFVATVKDVLQADQTLGGVSNNRIRKVRFPHTRYFFENYPIREGQITVEVEALVTTTTR